jgi:hypothetical protein
MQKHFAWWAMIGSFGSLAAAHAQTQPSQAPVTKYDGTYAFVSSAKVNETTRALPQNTLTDAGTGIRRSPLVIVNGKARLLKYGGTVRGQGELLMRRDSEPYGRCGGCSTGIKVIISGRIENNGRVWARQTGYYCSYD